MKSKTKSGLKIISNKRKAGFNYFFKAFFEACIVLRVSEFHFLRAVQINITEAYYSDAKG